MHLPVLRPLLGAVLLGFLLACGPAAEPTPADPIRDPARIAISVDMDDDIVAVTLSQLEPADQGTLAHEVIVEWLGGARATLDDARFTQHVADTEGDLVLAGRGCGADWNEEEEEVAHICTADLQLVELEPGEAHAYPVRIHPEVGPLRLAPGSYTVEQPVGWSQDGEQGEFTLTLTYEVE